MPNNEEKSINFMLSTISTVMKTCWVFLLVVFNLSALDNTGKKIEQKDLMTARAIWLGHEKLFYVLVQRYQDTEMPYSCLITTPMQ